MDDRILVEVYIPFVQTSLSMYLPMQAKLQDCMDVCISYIEKKQIPIKKQFYFYHENDQKILAPDLCVGQSSLHSGSYIILI